MTTHQRMEMSGEQLIAAVAGRYLGGAQRPGDAEGLRAGLRDPSTAPRDNEFHEVLMIARIGPVSAKFKGKLVAVRPRSAATRYAHRLRGPGRRGRLRQGTAQVQLAPTAMRPGSLPASRRNVGGKLAQIGSRLVDAAAAATADRFFEAFAAHIAARSTPAGAAGRAPLPPQAQFGFWSWLVSFLRHLFRRR